MKSGSEEEKKPNGQGIQKILIQDIFIDGSNTSLSKGSKPKTYLDKFKDQFQETFDQFSSSKFRRGSHLVSSNLNYGLQHNNEKTQTFNKCDSIIYPSFTRGRSQSFNQKKEQFVDNKYILDLQKQEDQEILKNTLQLKNQMSEFQIDMLKRTFANLKIFIDLEKQMKKDEYIKMIQNFGFLKLQKGSVVFEFGDLGEKYFIILKGSVYVLLKTNYGETVRKMKPIDDEQNILEKSRKVESENKSGNLSPFGRKNTIEQIQSGDQKLHAELFTKRSKSTMADFEIDSEPDLECKGITLKQEIKQKYPHFSIVASHYEGEGFGEYSLIKNIRRTATIITSQDTVFATVDKNEYNEIMKDHIETIFQKKIQFLRSFKIFESQEKKLSNLVMCFQSIFYQRGDIIYKEQDDSNSMYFIQSGEVEISMYESNLKTQKQAENEEEELDDQTIQMNRLFLVSSQKLKRIKKRVTLAILNDKSYFGEEEIVQKQKKRKTQAKVISAEFSGLKISLKNFLLLCRFTDVMKKLRLNYRMKQEWRDSYHVNCVETIQKLNSSNFSSISPPRQEEAHFSQVKLESPQKTTNNVSFSFNSNSKNQFKTQQSPILKGNKFGVSQELILQQKKQSGQNQNNQHDNQQQHDQNSSFLLKKINKNTIHLTDEFNKSQVNINSIPKDNINSNDNGNLINLQSFLGNQEQISIFGHLSSVSNKFNFSQSLSPDQKAKNQVTSDQKQESFLQSDLNKSTQFQSTCFSPIQRSHINSLVSNNAKKSSNFKIKQPLSLLSSYDTNQKNFKLNLQQFGHSRPITPHQQEDRGENQISFNSQDNQETTKLKDRFLDKNYQASEFEKLKTMPSRELVSISNEDKIPFRNENNMKYFNSLNQSFYNSSNIISPQKNQKQIRAYSTGKKNNISMNLSDCNQQNLQKIFQTSNRLQTSPSNNTESEDIQEETRVQQMNQGFSYYKYLQQNEEGPIGKKDRKKKDPISSSDKIDEQFLLQKYTQKFDNTQDISSQLFGVQLQNNSHLVYNYQKIHQKLMVNSNLIKSNEKGRRMMQYYNDVQKCQTGTFKKFISPFIFYKERNKEVSILQNDYKRLDERKSSLNRTTDSAFKQNKLRNKSMDASLEGIKSDQLNISLNQQYPVQQNNEKTDYKMIFLRKKVKNYDNKEQITDQNNLVLRISPLKIQSQQNNQVKSQQNNQVKSQQTKQVQSIQKHSQQ
ncbi:cyclic nucleotide-binding domain protein (macronuclear) [Tetrahymena thermophila SB210]|uniref:Cyclic nucleotide-binding domain protein n=1 Tax=Tetrahymena thermophila (strain SB210) TaxID=312017 RepID=Q245X6_TETTS|nr:cyclic nucleotide-binding domain protein [Tetrahymena thermophila SB210]EAS03507.1 cyclic nucleotide-binding domain protein [Tetrahymena thermophila SB210]|eukprot:XP_001023752.1 cyclic nucleotide-binding domain protein [Tetrahymena thermophila SB210]